MNKLIIGMSGCDCANGSIAVPILSKIQLWSGVKKLHVHMYKKRKIYHSTITIKNIFCLHNLK